MAIAQQLLLLLLLVLPNGSCTEHSYTKIIAAGIDASATSMTVAVEHFRTAIRLDPKHFDGHLNLASALLQLASTAETTPQKIEHLEQARVAADAAQRLRPGEEHAAKVLGQVVAAREEAVASQQVRVDVKPFVSGRKLVVMDNAVPEEERARVVGAYIAGKAGKDNTRWIRHYATGSSVFANAHGLTFDHKECLRKPMHEMIAAAARQHFPECAAQGVLVAPYSCVINSQTFVDVDSTHTDFTHTPEFWGFTAIWYPHEVWNVHWAGATAFVDDADRDIEQSVMPLPGRLALFDSQMRHMSTPATPISAPLRKIKQLANERVLGSRFSFAYKYICTNLTAPEIYRRVDADGSGGVSLKELGKSFGSPESPFPPLGLAVKDSKLLKKIDKNGDLVFSLAEFKELLKKVT